MSDERRIVWIADYDAGDAFCAAVGVERVGWDRIRYPRSRCTSRGIKDEVRAMGAIHFSSTSCLWPGFVRSATVLLKRDMNWP